MIKIYSPYSNELIGELEESNREQLDIALEIAKAAQKKWAAVTKLERVSILSRWAALLRENVDELATLIMKEVGNANGCFDTITFMRALSDCKPWHCSLWRRPP